MNNKLYLLKPQFKQSVPSEFYGSDAQPSDLRPYLDKFSREVDLEPAVNIVQKTMEKFAGEQSKSDAWLAPRLHATLRLTRREAGDRRLWNYLTAGPLLDYVHWRWRQDKEASGKFPLRFFGPMRDHAIARLWWGAELTRNGRFYESTKLFFRNTDVPNSWLNLRAMRHRPTAIAAVHFIYEKDIDGVPVGDRHRQLVRSLNAALTTTVLDAVSTNPPPDAAASEEWRAGKIDETLYFEDDPIGPNEAGVSGEKIDAVIQLLVRVAEHTNFKARVRGARTAS
jgi:hypothetical protein